MNRLFVKALFTLLLVAPLVLKAQEDGGQFYRQSLEISNIGMGVLGGWAVANMTVGAYGWSQQTGQAAYFHQMNLFWNTVNLTIAGLSLNGNLRRDVSPYSDTELVEMQLKSQRLYLINGALDVAYAGMGFLLRHLSTRYPEHGPRLRGYGNSVILQGAFLFVFDLAMYGLQRNHRNNYLKQISFYPMPDRWGVVLSYRF